ncbi:thermonuclease family protein [Peribacillus sp. SCS-155]|uniref:thermonuclease family protein n=1 Tax=Peribacillus sedimenti TaxID=3115297 RepID=UPI003905BC92
MKKSYRVIFLFVFAFSLLALTACQGTLESKSGQDTERTGQTERDTAQQNGEEKASESQPATKEAAGKTFPAKVVHPVDGDTVKIKIGKREETVRLLLVDTPETVHPDKPVQPFGREASDYVKKLLAPGTAIEVETGISERDKYGRLLAYLYVDGQMANKLLIEKGLARVAYVYAPNTKYIDEFRSLQEDAKKKKLGIWSIENYATDRGFDDTVILPNSPADKTGSNQGSSCANPKIKGNINSRGDKIYHVPSGQSYDATKAEEMFCTEADAKKAGFRKAQR